MTGRAHCSAVPPDFFGAAHHICLFWDQPCALLVLLATSQDIYRVLGMKWMVCEKDGVLQDLQPPWSDLSCLVLAIGN